MPNRRDFLRGMLTATAAGSTTLAFPPAIRRALAIPAHRRTGTIADVEHVVILTQENRSFDHYFGTLNGVRGFGDRFPIPLPDAAAGSGTPARTNKTVWVQRNAAGQLVAPFALDTGAHFEHMRVTGTPHSWPNAQPAWADGKLDEWPRYKADHSMGYFRRDDLPFQFALAEAFTLCDAYHCSFQGGTNPNRLFLWSGTNDPLGRGRGPALTNDYDSVGNDPAGGYTWLTYSERLQAAGISWQVYQNMADNFTDNALAGFRSLRASYFGEPGASPELAARGLATRDLDLLAEDVASNRLPAVSWIVATAEGSEHPGPSSPAQGADYTARVLEALTCNPEVWSKTVLFVNFDENDGFFDHVPPPAVPSLVTTEPPTFAGASTVDTIGEYHRILPEGIDPASARPLNKPYGLGPRVPMYVVSPWSKGGWVSSEVADHTSVIRFLEKRFGVREPNISPWRRAVCGDLTSSFDFADPDCRDFLDELPETSELADLARALPGTTTPPTPASPLLPEQEQCARPSRALPYDLEVGAAIERASGNSSVRLRFENRGAAGAVFHVYDRLHLDRIPRRYTVEAGKQLSGQWAIDGAGASSSYDLWLLGPNGFHRAFAGAAATSALDPEISLAYEHGDLEITLHNRGSAACQFQLSANAYFSEGPIAIRVAGGATRRHRWSLRRSARWYDFSARVLGLPSFLRRFAGRVENGRDGLSDPALGGRARGEQG
jgi:phospholipase C